MTFERLLTLHKKKLLSDHELLGQCAELLNQKNVDDVLPQLPEQVLQIAQKWVKMDEGTLLLAIPGASEVDLENHKAKFREGVRIMRDWFAKPR